MISWLMDIVKRIRTNPAIIIAYGLYLHFNCRSYRFASKSLKPITKRTHVSIWKWVQKYASLTDRFVIRCRRIKEVFVDETLLKKVNGENYCWLWLAFDKPNLHVYLLLFHISRERTTIFVCYQFFKQIIRTRFGNELIIIFTDGAQFNGILMRVNG
jgi:transposase-like protein